jgi:hypothetical protein
MHMMASGNAPVVELVDFSVERLVDQLAILVVADRAVEISPAWLPCESAAIEDN